MIAALLLFAVTGAVDAERAFAADAQTIGQWSAFRKYADDRAVMFTPQPVLAHEFLKGRDDPPKSVEWWPALSFSSCDGRTAVNTGPAFRPDGAHYGQFTTVWVAEMGAWKWVYDNGSPAVGSPPRNAATPEIRRASCRAGAPGAPIIAPLPLSEGGERQSPGDSGRGESADKTLGWDWKVTREGEHHFRAYLWNGRGYDRALVVNVPAPK